jgi:hypothetical protein
MREIMKNYNPKCVVYFTILITTISAFTFPVYALLFSKIIFIMLNP